jgi:hypothetical protein
MKLKLLFIALFSTLVLLSCKKEKTPVDNLVNYKAQIIGTWQATNEVDIYYDSSGKVVQTEKYDLNYQFQFVNATQFNANYFPKLSTYTITNINGETMLSLTNHDPIKIEINNGEMTWVAQGTLPDGGRGVNTTHFKKL